MMSKKVYEVLRTMTKKVVSFLRKMVTPSVTSPRDTNPSDATVRLLSIIITITVSLTDVTASNNNIIL